MTQAIEDLPPIREVIRQYELMAKKSLGQNFIFDLNITQKIARTAGDLQKCTVIEVGPGPGAFTRAILMEGALELIAIEMDPRCLKALEPLVDAAQGRLKLINQDALSVHYQHLTPHPMKIVANLPYNISTQLLMHWLDKPSGMISLTLMFQKEVAQRLVAQPNSSAYGRLSVLTQFRGKVIIAFTLPPSVFTPAPKVDSAVMHLVLHPNPLHTCSWDALKQITRYAFSQRRKMLRSTLKPAFKHVESTLEELGIEPTLRAENLSVDQFCRLAKAFQEQALA